MSTPRPVRAALIGFGGSARTIHLPLLTSTEGIELVAVVPTTDRGRANVAEHAPDLRVVDSIGELARHDVDVAVVATVDLTHLSHATEALETGLAVVVEKPLAPTVADAQQLVDLATSKGLLLAPFQNRRWDTDHLTVRDLIDRDVLGRVIRFESRITRWAPQVGPNWRDQSRPGTLDGRLGDLGAHLADQALALFGPVASVYGEVGIRRPAAVANDDVFLALTHESGVISHLHMSAISSARLPRMRVQGLAGSYVKYGFDPQQDQLAAAMVPGSPGWGLEDASEAGVIADSSGERVHPSLAADWRDFYRGIAAAISTDAPPPVAASDAVAVLQILEAGARSARDGTIVRLTR